MTLADILSQVWCHCSFVMGVLGNSYVIYATVISKAIRLDKLSIWIIQNLAVIDLMNTVLILVPIITSLYAGDQWILGDTFCKVFYVYKYAGFTANVVMINILSLNKMMRCLFPLRNLDCSRTRKWVVTTITTLTSTIIPVYSCYRVILDDKFLVVFSASQCMCSSIQIAEAGGWHKVVYYFLAGSLNGLPCLVLCVTNSFLVIYALKKSNRTVNKSNIVIVVLVTASFLLFGLPYFAYSAKHGQTANNNDSTLRIVTFTTFICLWSNPVIYLVTNRGFRTFTAASARRLSRAHRTSINPAQSAAVCQ